MKRNVKSVLAKALVAALVLSSAAAVAPGADAAKAKKPKLSASKVSVKKGKKKTVRVKGVKAKKVKKLTVKSKKPSIASVKKSSKTKFVITGKKKGKTTVTASVKVGKKATTLKVKVTVTDAGKDDTTQSGTPSPAPSLSTAPSGTPASSSDVTQQPETPPTTSTETPAPTPLVYYSEDFENGLGDWFARGSEESTELAILNTDEGRNGGKAMMITGKTRASGWEGPALDWSNCITPGGKYKVTFWAKVPEEDAEQWSEQGGIKILVSGARFHSKEDFENGTNQVFENYPADTSYKIKTDEWTQVEVEFTAPEYFYNYIFYIETLEMDEDNIFWRYGTARFLIDDFTIERLSAPAEFDKDLPSIKEAYAEHGITMGVAANYGQLMNPNTFGFIKHHFGSVTAGNEMKLDAVMGNTTKIKLTDEAAAEYVVSDAYKECPDNKNADGDVIVPEINFSLIDSYLRIAKENGMKVRIHSPFWHQQNPQHFFTKGYKSAGVTEDDYTDKETMYAREEMYVRTLLEHIFKSGYGDVVSAYDVVNEYLNMANEGGKVNHWKFIFGDTVDTNSPFVKKAFAVAYDELVKNNRTDISLIYNDYNTYNNPDRVVELINNINAEDDTFNPEGNKICDGIGMQSHINGSGDEDKFEAAIEKFKDAGFEIQITELDVTNSGTVTAETSEETKAFVWQNNAEVYTKLMNAILTQKAAGANITSVTLWGVNDATSWRAERAPLLFGADVADKKPSFDAVIDAAKNFNSAE